MKCDNVPIHVTSILLVLIKGHGIPITYFATFIERLVLNPMNWVEYIVLHNHRVKFLLP